MIDRCILHIGTEKTGTTSIQGFLAENRDSLAKEGVLVPKSLGASEHLNLVRAVIRAEKRFGGPRLGAGTPGPSPDARAKVIHQFRQELVQAKGFKLCIISSERFGMYVRTPEEMDILRNILLPYFKKVEVIVYLRPQIDLAVSRYSTELRKGITRKSVLPDFSATPRRKYAYDYESLLTFWEQAFPEAEIRPQLFSSEDLIDGDAVVDFQHRVGLKVVPHKAIAVKNVSFSAAAQSYLWAVNWLVSRGASLNTSKIIRKLHAQFSGKGRLPSRADAIAFMHQFDRSNDAIRARYFPKRAQLFNVDFMKFPEGETPLGLGDADYEAITLALTSRPPRFRRSRSLTKAVGAELLRKPSLLGRLKGLIPW